MKKLIIFSFVLFSVSIGFGQVPQVPSSILYAEMELTIDDWAQNKIQEEVDRLHKSPAFFQAYVNKADLYFPIVERVFKEEGFPDEVKYLMIQESGMRADVVSSSNAVGYWQFKKETGQECGLVVEDGIDERKNIEAASRAAAIYIKKNNKTLNNYVYALTAYNTGRGGVEKYVNDKYLGNSKMKIDKHTHWYFITFLAHYIAFRDFVGKSAHPNVLLVDYGFSGKSVKDAAQKYNLTYEELEPYNLWISKNHDIPANKKYAVIIPQVNSGGLLANQDSEGAKVSLKEITYSTKVFENEETDIAEKINQLLVGQVFKHNKLDAIRAIKGDNISRLAIRGDISKKKFLKYNDLRTFDRIKEGQIYYFEKKKRNSKTEFHVVKEGETLWGIAQFYGVRLKSLLYKNEMKKTTALEVGRVMWLRKARPSDTPVEYKKTKLKSAQGITSTQVRYSSENIEVEKPTQIETVVTEKAKESKPVVKSPQVNSSRPVHIVSAGQTLYAISRMYNVSVDDIIKWNDLQSTDLKSGSTLIVGIEKVVVKKTETSSGSGKTYVVGKGETLYSISRKFGVTVDQIIEWNNLKSSSLNEGQEIIIK